MIILRFLDVKENGCVCVALAENVYLIGISKHAQTDDFLMMYREAIKKIRNGAEDHQGARICGEDEEYIALARIAIKTMVDYELRGKMYTGAEWPEKWARMYEAIEAAQEALRGPQNEINQN